MAVSLPSSSPALPSPRHAASDAHRSLRRSAPPARSCLTGSSLTIQRRRQPGWDASLRSRSAGSTSRPGRMLTTSLFQTARAGSYQIGAPGVVIQVFNARGKTRGGRSEHVTLAVSSGWDRLSSCGSRRPAARPCRYSLSINCPRILAARRKVVKPRHLEVAPPASRPPSRGRRIDRRSLSAGLPRLEPVELTRPFGPIRHRGQPVPAHRSAFLLHVDSGPARAYSGSPLPAGGRSGPEG